MDLKLENRQALILGGSQGLGLSCARALAGEGVNLVLLGRDEAKAAQACEDLMAHAQNTAHKTIDAHYVAGDLANSALRKTLWRAAQEKCAGRAITLLVTNAGGPPPGPLDSHEDETWHSALETNMLAAIDFARMALPAMRNANYGRIINITSFTVRAPYPNMGLATGVRAGLTGAMAALAEEVAPDGITVNNLLPGLMDTPALARVYNAQAEQQNISQDQAKQNMARSVPMQRLGREEDFGPACAFLCSPLSGYITGQNITIDGGLVRALL